MCDTLFIRRNGIGWFAKNSDREPDEPQYVEYHPAVKGAHFGGSLSLTYIDIPQVPKRNAVIISRPSWMWGAEMGVNEHGLVIGNEALFSRLVTKSGEALLGMDLVRLALERASTADGAVDTITELLESYGQAGPAGYRDKGMRYDNGFLIADTSKAYVLETAGSHWAVKEIKDRWAISNTYSLRRDYDRTSSGFSGGDFGGTFDTRLKPWVGRARLRSEMACAAMDRDLKEHIRLQDIVGILRFHANGDGFVQGSNADLCMHARGLLRPSHTTNSMAVKLEPGVAPQIVFTATKSPCISLFKPTSFCRDQSYLSEHGNLWSKGAELYRMAQKDVRFRTRLKDLITAKEETILSLCEQGEHYQADQLARRTWHEMTDILVAA